MPIRQELLHFTIKSTAQGKMNICAIKDLTQSLSHFLNPCLKI